MLSVRPDEMQMRRARETPLNESILRRVKKTLGIFKFSSRKAAEKSSHGAVMSRQLNKHTLFLVELLLLLDGKQIIKEEENKVFIFFVERKKNVTNSTNK